MLSVDNMTVLNVAIKTSTSTNRRDTFELLIQLLMYLSDIFDSFVITKVTI